MADDSNVNGNNKVSMPNSMLTTADNPFNPFTQYDEWYEFDTEKGYDTPNYLARIAKDSDDLSEEDEAIAIEDAMDEIIRMNILGIYQKVNEDNFDKRPKIFITV